LAVYGFGYRLGLARFVRVKPGVGNSWEAGELADPGLPARDVKLWDIVDHVNRVEDRPSTVMAACLGYFARPPAPAFNTMIQITTFKAFVWTA